MMELLIANRAGLKGGDELIICHGAPLGTDWSAPDMHVKTTAAYTRRDAGILLQGDKDNYRAILVALQGVTGVPVAVAEKDREFVPVGVRSDVTNSGPAGASQEKPTTAAAEPAKGTVDVTSNPAGADVMVDGTFVGNCPATLKLAAGKHTITVKAPRYKDWSREMGVEAGSEVHLTANLEK